MAAPARGVAGRLSAPAYAEADERLALLDAVELAEDVHRLPGGGARLGAAIQGEEQIGQGREGAGAQGRRVGRDGDGGAQLLLGVDQGRGVGRVGLERGARLVGALGAQPEDDREVDARHRLEAAVALARALLQRGGLDLERLIQVAEARQHEAQVGAHGRDEAEAHGLAHGDGLAQEALGAGEGAELHVPVADVGALEAGVARVARLGEASHRRLQVPQVRGGVAAVHGELGDGDEDPRAHHGLVLGAAARRRPARWRGSARPDRPCPPAPATPPCGSPRSRAPRAPAPCP